MMVVVGDVTCSAEGHKDSLTSLAELEGPGPGAWGLGPGASSSQAWWWLHTHSNWFIAFTSQQGGVGGDPALQSPAPVTTTCENLTRPYCHTRYQECKQRRGQKKKKHTLTLTYTHTQEMSTKWNRKRTLVMRGHIPFQRAQHVLPRSCLRAPVLP